MVTWAKNLAMPLQYLKGAGPHMAKRLNRLGLQTVWDLLGHLPLSFKERTYLDRPTPHFKGKLVTLVLKAVDYMPGTRGSGRGKASPLRIQCITAYNDVLELIFFRPYPGLYQQMPLHQLRVVSGELDYFMGLPTLTHPDHMGPVDTLAEWTGTQPCYGLTAGLTQKQLSLFIKEALKYTPSIPEWLPLELVEKFNLIPWPKAIAHVHAQPLPMQAPHQNLHLRRLAFDELLSYSLALQLLRQQERPLKGYVPQAPFFPPTLLEIFPFSLTAEQHRVIEEIFHQLKSGNRMVRLLQGDVGSGKTAVAFALMALFAQEGYQTVLMAPTEILARQHAQTLGEWAHSLNQRVVVLTGQDKGRQKRALLESIQKGEASFIVGTHALFQESVVFHKVGLIVIDEQHRFGVEQRLRLVEKSLSPHLLSMTATPIPRSLLLTLYGDLDVSSLKEKPAYRQPVATSVIPSTRCQELMQKLPQALASGHKIFWVCPLIEKSDDTPLMSSQERYLSLQQLLGDQVGWVHGKMKGHEKENIIQTFKDGKTRLLVTTTVVEVGVDIPDATMIIIEHAERFGLAQLHQLRGRVGRGVKPGTCLLLYSYPLSFQGRQRLESLKHSHDGFQLAEADLNLRGGGELIGYKQSGIPHFKFADLSYHQDLLKSASDEAKRIALEDPHLKKPEHCHLRSLLCLFKYGQSLELLTSG